MVRSSLIHHDAKGLLSAMLGPTNTGKTHYAIERMASYKSGMIGFPLRLLARENYDRLVKMKGHHQVALITGEEKITPLQPRYYVCTVESMPVSVPVEFLCVDEIQLCADAERGHIFTDRLLRARGEEETLFLGALTMRDMFKTLLPGCKIETRDRMSPLTYTGYRKLTRLPARSAIVAFNINEVYRLAEFVRAQRGGTAIVLGALSPRTRNAQVEMYQNGDVDYLVATDAIGMGLNMDINHVALAATRKYDGSHSRNLRADELAQIAGRAGRYRSPGTFGVTDDIPNLDTAMATAIEEHAFEQIKQIRWRNPKLDFSSLNGLLRSLSFPPQREEFIPARQADDHAALITLSRHPTIQDRAKTSDRLRLLWEVCAIPDFRKTLTDEHHNLLRQIFLYLTDEPWHLPEDWCVEQIKRLDRTDGDLDTLLTRIAYTRTWTYITHVKGWLKDGDHWQAVTRQIEDRLSDALHERLTQRFVDKRASSLLRGLASRDKLLGGVRRDGTLVVEGHTIGRLQGWRFMAEESLLDTNKDAVMKAARTVLKQPLQNAIDVFAQQVSAAFSVDASGQISWRHGEDQFPIAKLAKGDSFYAPKIKLLHNDLLEDAQNKIVLQRLETWLDEQKQKSLGPLLALENAELNGTAKGIAFQLFESGGILLRSQIVDLIKTLEKDDRQALGKMGVRLGAYFVYQRDVLKPAAMRMKATMWRLQHDVNETLPLPQEGNVTMACPENASRDFYRAMGLPVFGKTCVRVDMVDRLNSAVYDQAKEGKYTFDPALASTVGVSVETVQFILHDLGFRFEDVTEGEGEEAKTTRFYHIKKRAPRLEEKPKEARADKPRRDEKKSKGKPVQPRVDKKPSAVQTHSTAPKSSGYNAFAGLAALAAKK